SHSLKNEFLPSNWETQEKLRFMIHKYKNTFTRKIFAKVFYLYLGFPGLMQKFTFSEYKNAKIAVNPTY
ncbi:hypothetical protein ACXYWI_03595, partial [Mesomycoplasma ovipneumoniae]